MLKQFNFALFIYILSINPTNVKAENYITYYNLINKAEWAAFNNNDKVAIDYYLKALTRFESKVDYYHYEDAVNLLIKNMKSMVRI